MERLLLEYRLERWEPWSGERAYGQPPDRTQIGLSGDPPQNTNGLLTTRHSYRNRENSVCHYTSSPSLFKNIPHSLPHSRQPLLCSPASSSLAVHSINSCLCSASIESFHCPPTGFHPILALHLRSPSNGDRHHNMDFSALPKWSSLM